MDFVEQDKLLTEIDTEYCNNISDCNILLSNDKAKNFNIFHKNIRSINKNFDETLILLENINVNFDIIVFTETWNIENKDEFRMEGYEVEYNEGRFNQNDGVVSYIRKEYKYESKIIKITEFNFLLLKIKLPVEKEFTILAAYRPPQSNELNFLNSLHELFCLQKNIDLIIGDINIDILNNNTVTQNYLNLLYSHGLKSTINKPTRETSMSRTCIDHIFLHENKFSKYEILPVIFKTYITDHYSTILNIKLNHDNKVKTKVNTVYKKIINYDMLCEKLENENWEPVTKEKM